MEFPTETARFGRKDVFFFLAVVVYVYTQLFQLPFTPIYFDGDVMVPVSNGMRMLAGEVIYKDFFHFIPPGADLVYENLFRIFGLRVSVINSTILILTLAQTYFIWFFSRKILTGIAVYLPPAIFLVFGFRQFGIDGSYRLFSMVFVLAAVAVLMDRRTFRRLFIAGCLCGFATFFVQTRGVLALAGISVFVLWENYREGFEIRKLIKSAFVLTGSFVIVVVLTQIYFLLQAGADNYYFAMVGFIRDHYRSDPFNNTFAYLSELPSLTDFFGANAKYSLLSSYLRTSLISLFFYLLIPYVYILFLVFWLLKRGQTRESDVFPRLVLLLSVGMFLAAGVSAPTVIRLYQVAIPGLVIFIWLCQQSRILRHITPAITVFSGVVALSFVIHRQWVPKYIIDMPAGRAAFLYKPTFDKYEWIRANTAPGDVIYEPHHPNFYFPFHLKNPTPLYMARDSDYTPSFQVDAVVKSLEMNRPKLIIWPKNWSKAAQDRLPGDHLEPLWQFVRSNYDVRYVMVKSDDPSLAPYGDNEVWQLKH